jgi:hypothetical protein
MRPESLPESEIYADELDETINDLVSIIHFRVPDKKCEKAFKTISKLTEGCLCDLTLKNNRYDHIAIAVDRRGWCYLGRTKLMETDQYSRKYGFRLAVKYALDNMIMETPFLDIPMEAAYLSQRDIYSIVFNRLGDSDI